MANGEPYVMTVGIYRTLESSVVNLVILMPLVLQYELTSVLELAEFGWTKCVVGDMRVLLWIVYTMYGVYMIAVIAKMHLWSAQVSKTRNEHYVYDNLPGYEFFFINSSEV